VFGRLFLKSGGLFLIRLDRKRRVRCIMTAASREGGEMPMQAYCVKCRAQRDIQNPQQVTLKNGRPATQGTCPVCNTRIFRIGKATA
jgi:hypothetical protein